MWGGGTVAPRLSTPSDHSANVGSKMNHPRRIELPQRSGLTLIELLVVIVIVALLLAIAIPAVMRAQEAARRTSCANNFRQIGLASANYIDAFNSFPPSEVTPWTVAVSPFLEQAQVYAA